MNTEILVEATFKFAEFFPDEYLGFDAIEQTKNRASIINQWKWAKQVLKKNDRITWFMKIIRLAFIFHRTEFRRSGTNTPEQQNQIDAIFIKELDKFNKKADHKLTSGVLNRTYMNIESLKSDLEHFLSLPIQSIINHEFKNDNPDVLTELFSKAEQEWASTKSQYIQDDPDLEVFLQCDSNFTWFDLETPSCMEEGASMGHCGNTPASNDRNQTIISLREKHMIGNEVWWRPVVTAIFHKKEKSFGEIKGRANEKPADRYHKYIVKILTDSRIKSIHGGGYKPETNFSIFDLPESVRTKLLDMKPDLATFFEKIEHYPSDSKIVIDALAAANIKIDTIKNMKFFILPDNTKYITTTTSELVDDYGNSTVKYVYGILSGDSFDEPDYSTSIDDVVNALSSSQRDTLKEKLQNEFPDYADETDDFDDFDQLIQLVFDNEDETILHDINVAYEDALRSGAKSEMFDDFNAALDNVWYEDEYNSVEIHYIPIDTTVNILDRKWKVIFEVYSTIAGYKETSMGGGGLTGADGLKAFMIDKIGSREDALTLDEPRYGWSGFDDEYFQSRVAEILK